MLKLGRVQPPVRRVLAIDAGSRSLKLLLAQSDFGRFRLLKQEYIDLHAEGLVSADETKAHLHAVLDELGRPPVAMVLPQHLSTSQVIDLPLTPEAEVQKLIHDEAVKLGGVSESRIVYDFVRIEAPAKNRQQFWVTLCQENEIRERLTRLGMEQEDLCEVTTTANALVAAFLCTAPQISKAILVHHGAQSTVVVILSGGQAAFATSYQMGGDFFTRSLARLLNCGEERAETLRRTVNFFRGSDYSADFVAIVDGWVAELKRQLNEWFAEQPGRIEDAKSYQLIFSGGGFEQPGFTEYVREEAGLDLRPWPRMRGNELVGPEPRFEVAFGTALQALGHSSQPASLLPDDYRLAWKKRLMRQRIEFASLALIVACILFLALGTWHKLGLIERKQELYGKVKAGIEAVEANDSLMSELVGQYELLRPVFAAQQNTLDTLTTYALLQRARTNRSFWYVVLADQQSYFNGPPIPVPTNRPVKTNLTVAVPDRPPLAGTATNLAPAKPGCIAELCVPEDAETARTVLSQLVNELKQQPLFSKVDLLSDDLRRGLADPKVVLPDRHFVLALDFAATEFQQPIRVRKTPRDWRSTPKRLPKPPAEDEAAVKSQVWP